MTVTSETKHLLFKGIAKKEQILFKSFLSLAKNELPYQIVIDKNAEGFDLVIVDETYEWGDEEKQLQRLPALVIGDDIQKEAANYLSRPVQWSDFKSALSNMELAQTVESDVTQESDIEPKQDPDSHSTDDNSDIFGHVQEVSLPTLGLTVENEIGGTTEPPLASNAYEFELDNESIDPTSMSNSHYEQVLDDVKGFNQYGDDAENKPVLLFADEESSFSSSVLVIETAFTDEWDIPSEIDGINENTISVDSEDDIQDKKGIEIAHDERFWLEDNEVIADNKSLFYIKTQRDMIYSPKEPGQWVSIFQLGTFSKLPMKSEWRPFKGLKAYPAVYLLWGYTYAKERQVLHEGLDENEAYLLEKWPKFELLELDNDLLRLCSLLFVKPETVSSLARKSKCDREQVIGFINACSLLGLLTSADQMQILQPTSSDMSESMFGKIKDVFK